ncbi:MAG TPA: hypothetical protein VFR24_12885 [Candidatus Angelobacter sp.]|nr:hypothetical protein [Candidatus Angelobacter sp.]
MSRKIIKSLLLVAMLAATLGAGTLSARQLRSESQGFACGTTCGSVSPGHFLGCPTGCFCVLPADGSTTGFCSTTVPPSQTRGK